MGDTVDDVNDPNYQGRGKGTPNTAKCVRVRFVGSRNKNKRGGGSGGGGGDDAGDFGEGAGQRFDTRKGDAWPSDQPDYVHFTMHKENIDTMRAVDEICNSLRIKNKVRRPRYFLYSSISYSSGQNDSCIYTEK